MRLHQVDPSAQLVNPVDADLLSTEIRNVGGVDDDHRLLFVDAADFTGFDDKLLEACDHRRLNQLVKLSDGVGAEFHDLSEID